MKVKVKVKAMTPVVHIEKESNKAWCGKPLGDWKTYYATEANLAGLVGMLISQARGQAVTQPKELCRKCADLRNENQKKFRE